MNTSITNFPTPAQESLSDRWQDVYTGAGQAIDWVETVRIKAKRLDSEADALVLRLRRARNLACSLTRVARTPMTIGFFGLSQAGKSYLISSLAAGKNGRLETVYGGQRLDFIEHVNPAGQGKEATGLVTRFSRTARAGDDDFPVELKLFSEVEIAKILANAYFNDFDQEHVTYEITDARIEALLAPYESRAAQQLQIGVTTDDVVSLWDYLNASFEKSLRKLETSYWPRVLKLAPQLSPGERAEVLSLLWGEQAELTRVYAQLALSLRKLGSASSAFAPLSALVKSRDGGAFSQSDSIMNVDILERFDTSADSMIDVRPAHAEDVKTPVGILVSHLAALTAELIFPLVEPTNNATVESVDLLDFPGYRGRLALRTLDQAAGSSSSSNGNPAAQLILRGKVAYLFERYTDSQEMNGLVLCTSADKQSDVTGVGPVLTRWIDRTQGASATERAGRKPGLIWAITMFDKRITGSLELSDAQLPDAWEGLVKMTMLERFGMCDWMTDWANNVPFHNTYLVRKPRLEVSFIDMLESEESKVEGALTARLEPRLHSMRSTFVAAPSIAKHVAQPDQAWDAMLALNDGGMGRLAAYVGGIATIDFKLDRIKQQLDQTYHDLLEVRLEPLHYKDGTDAIGEKRKTATLLWQGLTKGRALLPELLSRLDLDNESLRDLYLSGGYDSISSPGNQNDMGESSPSLEGDDPFSALFASSDDADVDPFAPQSSTTASAPSATTSLRTTEHRFARAVFKTWVAHLRELPGRTRLLSLLGIEKNTAEALVDELITAANRLEVAERIERRLLERGDSGSKREQLVMRQVLRAQTELRDFLAWFGFMAVNPEDRPDSLPDKKSKLFVSHTSLGSDGLPQLPIDAPDLNREYTGYWRSGLVAITVENAGHSKEREITIAQNEALGAVLLSFNRH